ncbi:hypothetical protein [Streptomyces cinereoruber]
MTATDDARTTADRQGDEEGDGVETQVSGPRRATSSPEGRGGKTVPVSLDGRAITPTRVIPAGSPLPVIRDQVAAPPGPVEATALTGRPQKARLLSNTRLVDLVGRQPAPASTADSVQRRVPASSTPEDSAPPLPLARVGGAPDDSWGEDRREGPREAGMQTGVKDPLPDATEEEEVEVAEPYEPERKVQPRRQRAPRSYSSDVPGSRRLPGFLDTPWRRFLLFWGTATASGGFAGVRVWFSRWANDPVHQVDGVLAYAITLVIFTAGVLVFRAAKFNPFALFGLLVMAAWIGSRFGPDLIPLVYPHTAKAGLSPYDTKLLANAIGLIGPMAWWVWLLRQKFWLWRWLACALLSSSILACVMFKSAS